MKRERATRHAGRVREKDKPMAVSAFGENMKRAFRTEMEGWRKWFAAGIAGLKAGVAGIAAAKSFQQFGREEEKES
jgi:hypothetical protein